MSNHIADANKMVREDVSDEQITAEATPAGELRRQILSPCVAKNEREWWASGTIEKLECELNAANDRIKRLEEESESRWLLAQSAIGSCEEMSSRIKRLEEAGDALKAAGYFGGFNDAVDKWIKVKEAKP